MWSQEPQKTIWNMVLGTPVFDIYHLDFNNYKNDKKIKIVLCVFLMVTTSFYLFIIASLAVFGGLMPDER